MDCGLGWPGESRLAAVLKELDTSKALMRKAQLELGNASLELARSGRSPERLVAFATLNHCLSDETERYRVAIQAFNVVCRTKALAAVA
jgi:hypothetical protein